MILVCRPTAAFNAAAAGLLERQPENEPKPSKALVGFATEEALSEGAASPSKIFSGDGSSLSDCVWSETEASGATKRSGCVSNGIQTPQVVAKSAAKLGIYQTSRIAKFDPCHDDRLRPVGTSAAADSPRETPAPVALQTPPKEARGHLRAPIVRALRAASEGLVHAPRMPRRSRPTEALSNRRCCAAPAIRYVASVAAVTSRTAQGRTTSPRDPARIRSMPSRQTLARISPRRRAAARSPRPRGRRTAPDPCPPSELTPRTILEGGGLRDRAWLAGLAGRSRPWSVLQSEPRQVRGT
jgi:hypothetical protein